MVLVPNTYVPNSKIISLKLYVTVYFQLKIIFTFSLKKNNIFEKLNKKLFLKWVSLLFVAYLQWFYINPINQFLIINFSV